MSSISPAVQKKFVYIFGKEAFKIQQYQGRIYLVGSRNPHLKDKEYLMTQVGFQEDGEVFFTGSIYDLSLKEINKMCDTWNG